MCLVANTFFLVWLDMNTKDFNKPYQQHKANAARRGIDFLLTVEQWTQVWIESGKWSMRGRGADKYCMCRIGDAGAYEIGNIYIDLGRNNVSAGNVGKVDSYATRLKKSKAMSGIPHPWCVGELNPMHRQEVKDKISAATKGGKHYRARKVITPEGIFDSGTEASAALGIPKPTIYWRCKNQTLGYSYA
jgi:hypothetical protein